MAGADTQSSLWTFWIVQIVKLHNQSVIIGILWHRGPSSHESTKNHGTNTNDTLDPPPLDFMTGRSLPGKICHSSSKIKKNKDEKKHRNWKMAKKKEKEKRRQTAHSQTETKPKKQKKKCQKTNTVVVLHCVGGGGVGGWVELAWVGVGRNQTHVQQPENSMVFLQSNKPDINNVWCLGSD